jgi:hypothetical protein
MGQSASRLDSEVDSGRSKKKFILKMFLRYTVLFCGIGHGRHFRSTIEQLEAANETLARQLAAANETLARQLAAAKPAAEEVHSEASVTEVAGLQQRVSRVLFFYKVEQSALLWMSFFNGITSSVVDPDSDPAFQVEKKFWRNNFLYFF